MKVMIVDDESLALSRLLRLLHEEGIEDVKSFDTPSAALIEATKTKFDVVFLDISMPQMSGLELANAILELEPKTFIVFQTAHSKYAIEAFKIGGIDYLMKPIESLDIKRVVEKIKTFKDVDPLNDGKLLGKRGNKIYLIKLNDIYFIKADLDEVLVRIKETDVYVKRKIGDLEKLLDKKKFFRIHRSIIVNVDKIKSMESVEQSKLTISFEDIDSTVTSSKDGAKEFREYLERRIL
jgi:two-component system LytT family response regulator